MKKIAVAIKHCFKGIFIMAIFLTVIGCATQNRHGKIKSAPCPCLDQARR